VMAQAVVALRRGLLPGMVKVKSMA